VNAAERDLVVRLTPDPSALLEFLDTAAGALITAADTLRAAYPVAEADAPEPWTPKVGDRVIAAPAKSTTFVGPGTVIDVRHRGDIPLVWVRLDSGPAELIFYVDELIPLVDEPPATVGPERLTDTARSLGCICGECRSQRELVADHVRDRLAQYSADALASQVYTDWFGAR
jgi:hypothetical protein